MSAIRHIAFVVALSLVISMMSIGLAMSVPAMQTSSAPVRPLHDLSAAHGWREQPGPIVILRVRGLVPEKVTLSDPAQGTVRATVLAIDEELHHIKVQTDEGQQLMLFLDPAFLARLQVSVPCLLQIAQQSTWESSRSPEHHEVFW